MMLSLAILISREEESQRLKMSFDTLFDMMLGIFRPDVYKEKYGKVDVDEGLIDGELMTSEEFLAEMERIREQVAANEVDGGWV